MVETLIFHRKSAPIRIHPQKVNFPYHHRLLLLQFCCPLKKLKISRKCLKRYTSMVIHLKMESKENYSFEDGVKRVVLLALNGIKWRNAS
uniref:Uncharacterized protein n=1 Tax=Helianthus annuus TaxID=4232 RepID=A0A251SGD3_HELAN